MDEKPGLIFLKEVIPPKVEVPRSGQITDSQLFQVFVRWKFERERYPGWIIAPASKRESVWFETKSWNDLALQRVKEWSATDRLLFYRELNWRMEVCLVPLFTDLVSAFNSVIAETATLILDERLESSGSELGKQKFIEVIDIEEAWLEIAFGLLREKREVYDSEGWNKSAEQLDQLTRRLEKDRDRFVYEQALWALWNVDLVKAKEVLASWNVDDEISKFALRKAGLFGELGQLEAGKTLLLKLLAKVRTAQTTAGESIELYSLEGWCMYLLHRLSRASSLFEPFQMPGFEERFNKLRTWNCDPFLIRKDLRVALKAPQPRSRIEINHNHSFDPGRSSKTISFPVGMSLFIPAFAYIRSFEEAGIPMYLPRIDISANELAVACRWIEPFTSFWSAALLLRAKKIDKLVRDNEILSRTNLAEMSMELSARVHNWCSAIWDREIHNLEAHYLRTSEVEELLACLIELLSRLSFRISQETLDQDFRRLLNLLPKLKFCRSTIIQKVDEWLLRLFEAADVQLAAKWVPLLLSLPVDDFVNLDFEQQFEPLKNVQEYFADETGLSSELSLQVEREISNLLQQKDFAGDQTSDVVKVRLVHLVSLVTVSEELKRRIGDIIWEDFLLDVKIPEYITIPGFCSLAIRGDEHRLSKFKQMILSLDPLVGGIEPRGKSSFTFHGRDQLPLFIVYSAKSSKGPVEVTRKKSCDIEWTIEEAEKLLASAVKWWQCVKELFVDSEPMLVEVDHVRVAKLLSEFLSKVIVPLCAESRSLGRELNQFIEDLEKHRVYMFPLYPYLSLFSPNSDTGVRGENKILDALEANDQPMIVLAVHAVRHYLILANSGLLKSDCSKLVRAVIYRVIFLRFDSLLSCIDFTVHAIVYYSQFVDSELVDLLTTSLDSSFDLLKCPYSGAPLKCPLDQPLFRQRYAYLVGVLKTYYEANGTVLPKQVVRWQTDLDNDPLPEVRRAFLDGVKAH